MMVLMVLMDREVLQAMLDVKETVALLVPKAPVATKVIQVNMALMEMKERMDYRVKKVTAA